MSWIAENKEWLFSGAGVSLLTLIIYFFRTTNAKSTEYSEPYPVVAGNADIRIADDKKTSDDKYGSDDKQKFVKKTLEIYKNETRILFIDDDTRFKVAKILAQSGWVHTKLIKDCKSLDDRDIVDAQLLFIDVQGVGVAMGFSDEGLGLALAIKEKYPNKKVIIYSAETQGNRFHTALRTADSFLAKNADPYEFQRLVEEFTVGSGR